MSQRVEHLYFAPSKKGGRGVFSSKKIRKGSVIEICPVVIVPKKELKDLDKTELFNYYFEWGKKSKKGAVALGYGSLYNHSYTPNAKYMADIEMQTLDIHAIRDIPAHTEICTNYNGKPSDKSKVWFDAKE